jgi:hypothetical protein
LTPFCANQYGGEDSSDSFVHRRIYLLSLKPQKRAARKSMEKREPVPQQGFEAVQYAPKS